MTLDKIRSKEEAEYCIQMYINQNDHSFNKIDFDKAFCTLYTAAKSGKFVRVLRNKNNKIIAWIYAEVNSSLHQYEQQLQQLYYCSDQSGITAYRCVVKLHEALIEEARKKNIPIVLSSGSHLDENNTFTKILEKNGWKRRGFLALYQVTLKHNS